MLAAVIPAAGASARMGRAKALLVYRGMTFIENILKATRVLPIGRVIIAIAQDDVNTFTDIDLTGVTMVRSAAAQHVGPIGSIRAVLRELADDIEGIIVWPVDQPHVKPETVLAMITAFGSSRPAVAVPLFKGRPGHPVIFARSVFHELFQAPDSEGARAVVRADPRRVLGVVVEDPAVLEDIDTPEAYAALLRRESAGS